MHDWTLVSIIFEWKQGRVTLNFNATDSQPATIIAENVVQLEVPQRDEWGRSVSVNEMRGPSKDPAGCEKLEVEIQSGDIITIKAKSFRLPHGLGACGVAT